MPVSYPELTLCDLPKKTFYYYPYLGPSLILIGEVWRQKQAETDYSGLLSKIVSDVSRPFRQASWGRVISDTKFAFYEDGSTSRIRSQITHDEARRFSDHSAEGFQYWTRKL